MTASTINPVELAELVRDEGVDGWFAAADDQGQLRVRGLRIRRDQEQSWVGKTARALRHLPECLCTGQEQTLKGFLAGLRVPEAVARLNATDVHVHAPIKSMPHLEYIDATISLPAALGLPETATPRADLDELRTLFQWMQTQVRAGWAEGERRDVQWFSSAGRKGVEWIGIQDVALKKDLTAQLQLLLDASPVLTAWSNTVHRALRKHTRGPHIWQRLPSEKLVSVHEWNEWIDRMTIHPSKSAIRRGP